MGIGKEGDPAFTLQENHCHAIGVDGYTPSLTGEVSQSLRAGGSDHVGYVLEQQYAVEKAVWPDVTGSLLARADSSPCIDRGQPFVCYDKQYAVDFGRTADRVQMNAETAVTLQAKDGGGGAKTGFYCLPVICAAHGQANAEILEDMSPTLNCNHEQPFIAGNGYIVRRLTPTECERLMGFPDGWTEYGHDGKKISDSARYRALGNSVAIPCVERVLISI